MRLDTASQVPMVVPVIEQLLPHEQESGRQEVPEAPQRTVTLEVGSLLLNGSPRLEGEDEAHTRLLAEADAILPPILVHRGTMRVVDGVHRVKAAIMRGQRTIRAAYFDGDASSAFVHAVRANISHGLPLSLTDRKAAAERILSEYPEWSDRAIATVTGLSATAIRAARDRSTDRSARLNTRVGQDGRVRPVNFAAGRQKAAQAIVDRPDASLREIARVAGVSVATALDVRRRLESGQSPLTNGRSRTQAGPGGEPAIEYIVDETGAEQYGRQPLSVPGEEPERIASLLQSIKNDPSLRYSERGRDVIRWLDTHTVHSADWRRIVEVVPPHSAYVIAKLAQGCADGWTEFANQLVSRAQVAGDA